MTVKPRVNLALDVIILVLFVAILISGLLLWQVYPEGKTRYRGGHGDDIASTQTVLGLDRADMREVHNWAGVLMGVLVLVHLFFHWRWLVCQTRRLLGLSPHPRRAPSG